jgi:hypothetical protein
LGRVFPKEVKKEKIAKRNLSGSESEERKKHPVERVSFSDFERRKRERR